MLKILQLFFLSFLFFSFLFVCLCILINYSHLKLPLKDEDTVFNRWRNIQLYWVTCYSKRIHLHYAMVGSKWKKTTSVSEGRENWSCKSGSLSGSALVASENIAELLTISYYFCRRSWNFTSVLFESNLRVW